MALTAVQESLKEYRRDLEEVRQVQRATDKARANMRAPVTDAEVATLDILSRVVHSMRATLEKNEAALEALTAQNTSLTKQVDQLKARLAAKNALMGKSGQTKSDEDEDSDQVPGPLFFTHLREAWSIFRHGK